MDLFRSHTQRAVEGSDLPCPSDCISGVLIQVILFIADRGAAGTELRGRGGSSAEHLRMGVRVRTRSEASVPDFPSLACPINLTTPAPTE